MKALRFNQTGSLSELRVTSMAQPVPRHGEVLVTVQAAAINPSDVKNVLGKMSSPAPTGLVPSRRQRWDWPI
jgi:NADPH2:quinone reductase